jgi:hypothetical protein
MLGRARNNKSGGMTDTTRMPDKLRVDPGC